MAGGATFSCDSCGKQYPWKPELAGKKAKCKCGALLNIPAQPQMVRAPVAVAAVAPVEETQAYRCPACQADLAPGTAVCINCGYDLRTGQYVSTQVDTGEDDAEAAPVPRKKKKKKAAAGAAPAAGKPSATGWVGVSKTQREKAAEAEADKSRTIKHVTIAGVLVVVIIGVIFGGKFAFSKFGNKGSDVKMLGQDAEATRMLNENQPMEPADFINSHKSRMIGTQWTQAKALAKVKQWYEMGAVKIYVPSDGLIARFVIVELPEDKEKRAALINWQRVNEDENGHIITIKDEGQKYVIYAIP